MLTRDVPIHLNAIDPRSKLSAVQYPVMISMSNLVSASMEGSVRAMEWKVYKCVNTVLES